MQFATMGDYLSQLEDIKKGKNPSELDMYYQRCLECISQIGDLYPNEVLSFMQSQFSQYISQFQKVANDQKQFYIVCKDLTVYIRAYEMLVTLFEEDFNGKFQYANQLISIYIDLIKFGLSSKMYTRGNVYAQFMAETFNGLQGFGQWVARYNTTVSKQQGTEMHRKFEGLLTSLLTVVVKTLEQPDMQNEISYEASNVLYKLASWVKISSLFSMPPFQAIYQNVHKLNHANMDIETMKKLYLGISHAILIAKPHNLKSPQELPQIIKAKYKEFMGGLLSPILSTIQSPGFVQQNQYSDAKVCLQISRGLLILSEIVASVRTQNKQAKAIVYENIQPILGILLNLFKLYFSKPQVLHVLLYLLLQLFKALKVEIGLQFIEQTVK